MLRLYHGKILKVVSPRFTTLNWGRGGDEVCSVNVHKLSKLGWIGLKGYVQDCSLVNGYINADKIEKHFPISRKPMSKYYD